MKLLSLLFVATSIFHAVYCASISAKMEEQILEPGTETGPVIAPHNPARKFNKLCRGAWCGHPGGMAGWLKDQQTRNHEKRHIEKGPVRTLQNPTWFKSSGPIMCNAIWCGHPGGYEGWVKDMDAMDAASFQNLGSQYEIV